MDVRKILIGGEWTDGPETIRVTAPYSAAEIAEVYSADMDGGLSAVAAAADAAVEMRGLSRYEIATALQKISTLIAERREEFAQTIALEAAKPIRLARGEVDRASATFHIAAGEAERFVGEVIPVDIQPNGRGKTAFTLRVPRGVIFGITPFNFPLNLVAHKVAPALASGNSIIVKPSPRTPLTAIMLGEVFLESGFPRSALQVVPIDVRYLDDLLADERIKMLSFTGSAHVGWALKARAGKKPVALELGGNAPVIVDSTGDMDRSISRTLTGAFAYTGQVCISVQRILVQSGLFDEWTSRFVEGAKRLKTGDPINDDTDISAMIDESAAKRAEEWIKEAVDHGARLLCGGKREGSLLQPTILTNTDAEMRIVSEEAFAPVVVVEPFAEFDEAVAAANDSKYGLQVGIFTNDLGNARYGIENLEYGGVIINDVPTFRVDNMPYGGSKDSGFGREGVRYAMEEMTELRVAVLD